MLQIIRQTQHVYVTKHSVCQAVGNNISRSTLHGLVCKIALQSGTKFH